MSLLGYLFGTELHDFRTGCQERGVREVNIAVIPFRRGGETRYKIRLVETKADEGTAALFPDRLIYRDRRNWNHPSALQAAVEAAEYLMDRNVKTTIDRKPVSAALGELNLLLESTRDPRIM